MDPNFVQVFARKKNDHSNSPFCPMIELDVLIKYSTKIHHNLFHWTTKLTRPIAHPTCAFLCYSQLSKCLLNFPASPHTRANLISVVIFVFLPRLPCCPPRVCRIPRYHPLVVPSLAFGARMPRSMCFPKYCRVCPPPFWCRRFGERMMGKGTLKGCQCLSKLHILGAHSSHPPPLFRTTYTSQTLPSVDSSGSTNRVGWW